MIAATDRSWLGSSQAGYLFGDRVGDCQTCYRDLAKQKKGGEDQLACPDCSGSGWKDFAQWSRNGYRIDCSSGQPLASLVPVAMPVHRSDVWLRLFKASA